MLDGHVTLSGIDEHTGKGWQPLPGFAGPGHWRALDNGRKLVLSSQNSVQWQFVSAAKVAPKLGVVDGPAQMPAVVSEALDRSNTPISVLGLDGQGLDIVASERLPASRALQPTVSSWRCATPFAPRPTTPLRRPRRSGCGGTPIESGVRSGSQASR